jgi:hypothetical protein
MSATSGHPDPRSPSYGPREKRDRPAAPRDSPGAPAGPSAAPGADAVAYAGVPKDRARTELRIRLGLGAEIPRSVALLAFPDAVIAEEWQQLHRRTDWQILFLRPDAIRTTMTPISFRSELNNLSRRRSARRVTQCWASSRLSRLNVEPWEELPLPEGTAALRPTDCSAAERIRSGARWLAGWRAVASGDAQSRAHRAVVLG